MCHLVPLGGVAGRVDHIDPGGLEVGLVGDVRPVPVGDESGDVLPGDEVGRADLPVLERDVLGAGADLLDDAGVHVGVAVQRAVQGRGGVGGALDLVDDAEGEELHGDVRRRGDDRGLDWELGGDDLLVHRAVAVHVVVGDVPDGRAPSRDHSVDDRDVLRIDDAVAVCVRQGVFLSGCPVLD